jgi:hypothetical protein
MRMAEGFQLFRLARLTPVTTYLYSPSLESSLWVPIGSSHRRVAL